MINRIKDWNRPFIETLLIIIIGFIFYQARFADKMVELYKNNVSDISELVYFQFAKCGNIVISIGAAIIALIKIRHLNKENMLNQSGNLYHDHSYFGYWYCAKVLGYQNCSLIRVPIPMQFKLIIYGTFKQYHWGDEDAYTKIENENITVIKPESEYTSVVNLVLADTYPIKRGMLSASTAALSTIFVCRDNEDDCTRCISSEFVKTVRNTVLNLPNNVTGINLYSTLNPKHCEMIANQVLRNGGRGNITTLMIYPQKYKNGNWNFDEKGVQINMG